jgi:hypothetical protein
MNAASVTLFAQRRVLSPSDPLHDQLIGRGEALRDPYSEETRPTGQATPVPPSPQ